MIILIILMSVSLLIGSVLHKKKNFMKRIESLTNYSIWLLLFLLGASIGANSIIINNLANLGFKALLLSLSATTGSMIFAYLLYKYSFNNEK